jgi:hypothetical protein
MKLAKTILGSCVVAASFAVAMPAMAGKVLDNVKRMTS